MHVRKEHSQTLEAENLIRPIYRMFIELTNGKGTSAFLRRFARSKKSRAMIRPFSNAYNINKEEMEKSLDEYPTLHDFFIRRLKDGLRQADANPAAASSPVDAVIEDIGIIQDDHMIRVKGKDYSIEEMLGNQEALEKYRNGYYMIFYLSPSHYHRIHSPVTGTLKGQWTLGGKSYPVNKHGLKYGKAPLSKNYRTVTEVVHAYGHLAIVKVGAMFVNTIEATHKGDQLEKGKEMAYFSFGSTVVLLFEAGTFKPAENLHIPAHIKVGETIGEFMQN
jgi:phosphatidylserine decarboxylase